MFGVYNRFLRLFTFGDILGEHSDPRHAAAFVLDRIKPNLHYYSGVCALKIHRGTGLHYLIEIGSHFFPDFGGQQFKKIGAGDFLRCLLKSECRGRIYRDNVSPAVQKKKGLPGGVKQSARSSPTIPQGCRCAFTLGDFFAQRPVPPDNDD